MLRQAVESNLDVIHDRMPAALRPGRQWVGRLLAWSWRVAVPVAVVLAAAGLAQRLATTSTSAGSVTSAVAPTAVPGDRSLDGVALSTQPFSPGVLGLRVRRIVIDAGHGGRDVGAASADGLEEKTITLDIARRLSGLMAARGFDVVLTRDADETVSLQERAAIANQHHGDLFVSIHLNALEPASARGIETYYLGPSDGPEPDAVAERENQHAGYSMADLRSLLDRIYGDARRDESRRLAHAVQRAMVDALRATDPATVDRHVKMAPFVVLIATEMPAILAEVSCLSNPDESRRLGEPGYRQVIADALASGVTHFARTRG